MARARIPDSDGRAALSAAAGGDTDRTIVAVAVRYSLQALADRAPGTTVEVRVPPYGAVQCIEGPRHTRGTPPNVIETDPVTWIAVATGALSWSAAVEAGRILASGARASLHGLLPLTPFNEAAN